MKRYNFLIFKLFNFYILAAALLLTGCSDILETDSNLVEYEKNNTLNHPVDSFYSVMGVINRMEIIADRTVLLGEARGDLMTSTEAASADLKRLVNFDFSQDNKYNQVSDYYAVINNCNYFLEHVDTTLERRGRKLFKNEYAAVKGFRAWTYLELVKAYGQVPLVTRPLMTEKEAQDAMQQQRLSIQEICNYFIDDLTPLARVTMPDYGSINNIRSEYFFIPMRALLGDLCLWAGRYEEAAAWYNSYLNDDKAPLLLNKGNRSRWTSIVEFTRPSSSYDYNNGNEFLSLIPMDTRIFDGTVSDLDNIYNSTRDNNYFFQLTPSKAMRRISAEQINCIEYKTATTTDTVYAPRTGMSDELLLGDLRLYSNYRLSSAGSQDPYSEYSSTRQTISKVIARAIPTYRLSMVYLHYAEALNRAGYPQSAVAILKYGLCEENAALYVDSLERVQAGTLIQFDPLIFTREEAIGIHSHGSGDSECNAFYVLPMPEQQLATRQDTVNYQIPLVEDMIVTEEALEGAFEGHRFYDLMRVALRRNDPAYLADLISRRNGDADATLRALLMDTNNWYLPLP